MLVRALYSPNPWIVFPWINGIKLLTKLFQFCHLTSLTLIRSGYHVPRHATMFYDKRTKKYKGWVHGCPFFLMLTSFYSLRWINRNLFYYSTVFCMFDMLYNENYTFRPKKKKNKHTHTHTYNGNTKKMKKIVSLKCEFLGLAWWSSGWDFTFQAGGVGLILARGAKIPHALGPKHKTEAIL